jgi:hypothetical protein
MWMGGRNDRVSSHNSRPPWKCLYHSNSVDHLNVSSPNATIYRLLSFLSNFSCLLTNFTQMCYSSTFFFIKIANSYLSFNEIIVFTQQHVRIEWTIPIRSSLLNHIQSLHSHQKFLEWGFLHSPRSFWTDIIHMESTRIDKCWIKFCSQQ